MTIDDELHQLRASVHFPDAATAERIRRLATRGQPRRYRATLMVAAAALVIAGGAIAAIKEVPWWQSGSPALDPEMVALVARDNMPAKVRVADARTVAQDGNAALVAVPLNATGYCLIPALDGRANLGAQCEYQLDDRTESFARPGAWVVYGRIADPRAATIDLGAFSVRLKTGGFFVARVPENKWSALGGTANPGRILDGAGSTLRTGCVDWGHAPGDRDARTGGLPLWRDGSGACRPEQILQRPVVDLGNATPLFDVTLTEPYSIWKAGTTISFVDAPATDGTTCVTVNGPGLTSQYPNGPCRGPGAWRDPLPLIIELSGGRYDGKDGPIYAWSVMGITDPGAHIARLELRSPSRTTPVSFAHAAFFGQLPATTASVEEFPAGPFTLEAFDSAGKTVASIDLNAFRTHASPH